MLSLEQLQDAQLRRYDRERRVRLIRLFAPIQVFSAIISNAVFLAIALFGSIRFLTPVVSSAIFAAVLLLAGCFWIAYVLAGRDRPNHAAALAITATASVILVVQTAYVFNDQFGTIAWMMFVADSVVIVMAATIGTRSMVVGLTLVCGAYMVMVLLRYYLVDGRDTTPHHELLGTVLTGLLILLGLATYTLLLQGGFYRMARDTGHMRYAIEQGRQLDHLKDQFIITVNHELRNPVMALLGNLDTLNRAWPHLDDEARQQYVESALVAGQQMRGLLESILDIRRIESADAFTPAAVDIRACLDQAVDLVPSGEGDVVQRDLRVSIPPGLAIWGDAGRLQQVFLNLLSNATKYSASGTPIEVKARLLEPSMVQIAVRDYGLGIPREQIPLLFQRFVRLERDLASNVVGNGLGLYLCRQFVQSMGGEIWVESTGVPGKGSTFLCTC